MYLGCSIFLRKLMNEVYLIDNSWNFMVPGLLSGLWLSHKPESKILCGFDIGKRRQTISNMGCCYYS